ncbi:MAG TPA: isoleucine--tRNA ligase [Gemmatimonadaceae bacterium]|nr:isoleucine--tRNA ligase [Gemmatimonadaceae bacterium]
MTAVDPMSVIYRPLPADRRMVEEDQLARWTEERLFEQQLVESAGRPTFIFYEGPPTANGRPGIHHVFARTVKDLFCRHRAMRGYHVPRKAGWDTHGLPVELEIEKQLGIKGKPDIEKLGIEHFNRLCRESVWKYRGEWERLSARIGYWLDYERPYVTYSNDYVESVWWALAELHRRGLLFNGHKVLPYCPRCETALSSHEVALGYKDVEDPSVYVALDLGDDRRILVWTTTPWTLVSNVALAVHPTLDYVELRRRTGTDRRTLILAAARAAAVLGEDYETRWESITRFPGSQLVGLGYRRPIDWVPYPETGKHEVIVGESFVTAEDGSGVVHMAPAFGADDYAAGRKYGLAFLQPVNARGEFPEGMPVVGGLFIKRADEPIIAYLRERGLLWKAQRFEHSYPHCWRCGTPLLYYARSSWFVRTTGVRDAMLERNGVIDWHPPEVGTGRFGEWLSGNVDWAISRDRYWGTPLPLWVCDTTAAHVEAIGSYEQLSAKVGRTLGAEFDPHKPFVDALTWQCSHCEGQSAGTMRRVPEVIDAWFDSGSMPFAQWHYPFEHRETVARQFPADFIAEGVDQTRGWFYSLLAVATTLGDALPNNTGASPYRSVVVNDLVLDANGQKMSKSRGNATDPWAVIDRHGADAVRLFLIASSQVWIPRRFDEEALRKTAGGFLTLLRELYSGVFAQFANFGWTPSELDPPVAERTPLDRWVLSRLAAVEAEADARLTDFDATLAVRAVMDFVENDVSKWYVRRSRHRFWGDDRAAFATLHEVLVVTCRLLAPITPFVTDWIHRELTGTSVHLSSYVRSDRGSDKAARDVRLEEAMEDVRQLVALGHAARDVAEINTRQPLSRVVCVLPRGSAVESLVPLLEAELNVKRVEFLSSADSLVTLTAKANFRALGKKFGKLTPIAADAVGGLHSKDLRLIQQGGHVAINVEGRDYQIDLDDLTISHQAAGDLVIQEARGYVAALDVTLTPALVDEGLAREVIRGVQGLRKDSGLAISDRIRLAIWGDAGVEAAVRTHQEWIAGEVLARTLIVGEAAFDARRTVDLDGRAVHFALTREVEP